MSWYSNYWDAEDARLKKEEQYGVSFVLTREGVKLGKDKFESGIYWVTRKDV